MANGAPVDFPGQVFPIPDGRDPAEFKPRLDTDPPYVKPMQGATMNDGVYRGGMKMDMSSPPMNQMTPGLMQQASTRNAAPIRVQLPDGNIGEFPGSMSHEAIEAVLQKQYPSPSRKRTPAPPGTAVISSAPDRGIGRRMLDTLRNGPFGFAMEETMPKVADALGLTPTLSQNNPEYQAAKTGQIGPVNLPQLVDANQPDTAAGFGKGMARGALRGVGMLARPDNLAMLASGPLGESKVAQTVFLSQMTEGAANQIENSVKLARQGKYAEAGEQAGGAATDLYFGRKMARHEGPMPVEEVEAVKDNPTAQVATAGRPEPPSVNSSEYNRLKARIAEIQQQSKKGSQDVKTQTPVVEAKPTTPSTPAEKPNATALPPEARGESVPTAQKSEVTPTLEDVAKDWKATAQAGPSPERKILADMALNPAEDIGKGVRQEMPAMPRGEKRKVERTPEEQATQTFFNQARQELGEKATSDQVMARVDELKYKAGYGAAEPAKPDVRDLYAQPGAKEAELTPEQKQANRDAFLGMTKKYSGENALGPASGMVTVTPDVEKMNKLSTRELANAYLDLEKSKKPEALAQSAFIFNQLRKRPGIGTTEAVNQLLADHRELRAESTGLNEERLHQRLEELKQQPAAAAAKPRAGSKLTNEIREAFTQMRIRPDDMAKMSRMRTKFRVKEEVVPHGQPIKIPPTGADYVFRDMIVKTPDGKWTKTVSGSYDTILNTGAAAGRERFLPLGSTVYVLDHGAAFEPGTKNLTIYRVSKAEAAIGQAEVIPPEKSGPGLGPRGQFARVPKTLEGEAGAFSLRPLRKPPNVKPSMMDRLRMAAYDKLNPSPDEQATMNIIRERGAEYAQKVEQISAAFDEHVKAHDSDGDAEMRTFMDAGEGKPGAQFANGKDAAVAQVLKDEFQDRWQKLSKIPGREKQGAGIENYLKHLFVGPKGQDLASQIMFGKRPLKGSASFTKHRFYEFMSDGMDMGNVPVTYNPIRMQMLGLFEIDRYLMAHSMKNDMRSSGLVKFIKNGADRPEGWQKINDEIFQPRVRTKGGFTAYGDYYAPKDAAKVFNNYLSPGLRGNLAYDVVRNYGNLLNQVQLGFSAYHASFSALNSGVNDLALGLQKALGGDIPGGLHNAIRGTLVPWSAYSNYKLGKMIEQEYVTPGSNPSVARLAQALKEGGGRIGMDPMYENRAVEAFKRQWKSNPISLKTPFHGVEAMAEKSSAYIMKYFVPRLKIGAFANLAENKMEELNARGANHDEYVTELGKLWDSVDNRMGQLTYDNLFWKKTYKDLGMVGVRSLGWNLGSFREGGGAVKDTLLQALGKQKLQMTPRQAYALALPILVGAYGTILGHLMGHPPHNTEDRFFPQTGGVDASGKPERLSLPSYMRDVYAFRHAPGETAINKAHPLVAELAELYQNHDFYNTEIRDTEAPIGQQALQVAKYLGKNFEPFGIQATQRRLQAGESLESSLGGMVGLTPAPKYIGQSKAEELSYDIAKRHMEQGPFPAGTQQQRQNLYQIRNQFHAGHLQMQDLVGLVRSGKLSVDQAAKIADEKGQPPLVRHFNTPGISWDERLKIWDAGTPEEKAELKPHLIAHIGSLQNLLPEQRMAVEKRLREIFSQK